MEKKDKIIIFVTTATLVVTLFGTIVNPILQDEPIVNVWLGNEQNLPLDLYWDTNIFPQIQYANIYLTNVGKTSANFDITVISNNATISFDKHTWLTNQTRYFSLEPTQDLRSYKIYVIPDANVTSFSIALIVTNPNSFTLEELNTPNEQKSTYHKTFDGSWVWSD